jgi:hypothetical protein
MRLFSLILVLCLMTTSLQSQEQTKIKWHKDSLLSNSLYSKSFDLNLQNSFSMRKVVSLKYNSPNLPFFCNMEDKSRNRFNIFLKFRAGNDESYRKMIQSGSRLRD